MKVIMQHGAGLRRKLAMVGALMAVLPVGLLAQTAAPAGGADLQKAIALYQEGKPKQAQAELAGINPQHPDYVVARCYDALCLYQQKDYEGYWRAVDAPPVKSAAIPAKLQEELGYRQVDALFRCREFKQLLPKIGEFPQKYPASDRLPAIKEYHLAALYEWGGKKALESLWVVDAGKRQVRWAEAQTNLHEFLALAKTSRLAGYKTLAKRTLEEDIWAARITLGEENEARQELAAGNDAARERFDFLKIKLHLKLREKEVDENLRELSRFLEDYPEASGRKRVEFEKAGYSFQRVERSYKLAAAAEKAGDRIRAAELRASVANDLSAFRSLQERAVVDEASGIKPIDILDLRNDLLNSYILEKNYGTVAKLTAAMINAAVPGDLDWLLAKTYAGIALESQEPSQSKEAATVLEEAVQCDFSGKPDRDFYVLLATQWRIAMAVAHGELPRAQELAQWVLAGKCQTDLKANFRKFLRDYPRLLPPPQPPT